MCGSPSAGVGIWRYERRGGDVGERGDLHVGEGDVDVLPLGRVGAVSVEEGREDGGCGVEAC